MFSECHVARNGASQEAFALAPLREPSVVFQAGVSARLGNLVQFWANSSSTSAAALHGNHTLSLHIRLPLQVHKRLSRPCWKATTFDRLVLANTSLPDCAPSKVSNLPLEICLRTFILPLT